MVLCRTVETFCLILSTVIIDLNQYLIRDSKAALNNYFVLTACVGGRGQCDRNLRNFATFAKIEIYLAIFRVYLVIGNILSKLWQILYAIGKFLLL